MTNKVRTSHEMIDSWTAFMINVCNIDIHHIANLVFNVIFNLNFNDSLPGYVKSKMLTFP